MSHILSQIFRYRKPVIATLFILIITLSIVFTGCQKEPVDNSTPAATTTLPAKTTSPVKPSPTPTETKLPDTSVITMVPEPTVEPSEGQLSFSATPDIEDLKDVHWISPGKVNIDNLYPGARAEYPLSVHNGGDTATEFSITVRLPDNPSEGYEVLPENYLDWVTVEQPLLSLDAKQTADVLIVIIMPPDVDYSGKKAEFWISVIDQGQSGTVRTELASRWLISTK